MDVWERGSGRLGALFYLCFFLSPLTTFFFYLRCFLFGMYGMLCKIKGGVGFLF